MNRKFVQIAAILLVICLFGGLAAPFSTSATSLGTPAPEPSDAGEIQVDPSFAPESPAPAPAETPLPGFAGEMQPAETPSGDAAVSPDPAASQAPIETAAPIPTTTPAPTPAVPATEPPAYIGPDAAVQTLMAAEPADTYQRIGGTIVRIGICFGTNAPDAANLINEIGSGFWLGYYDADNNFVPLGYTDETAVSVAKTTNVGYGTYNGYTSYHEELYATAAVRIGAVHIQLPQYFGSFAEAQAAASAYPEGFPAWVGGRWRVRIGAYGSDQAAAQANLALGIPGSTITGSSAYSSNLVVSGTSRILFQFDDLGQGTGFGVKPKKDPSGQKCITLFNPSWVMSNNRWYGGFRYERIGGGNLTVVNMIAVDDYVKGVVPTEMGSAFPLEALKAQAVCARTYALEKKNHHKVYHFDVCTTTDCQAYSGLSRAGGKTDQAVDETGGVVARYDGNYASCTYYSSNGGATMNSSDVFGTNQSWYPYLVEKLDPFEDELDFSGYAWSRSYGAQQLTNALGFASTIVSAQITKYSNYGNPLTIVFKTANGRQYTMSTSSLVSTLHLTSYRYDFGPGGGNYKGIAGGQSETVVPPAALPADGTFPAYAVNGSDEVVPAGHSAYVLDGNGQLVEMCGNPYVITSDSELVRLDPEGEREDPKSVTVVQQDPNSDHANTNPAVGMLYTGTNGVFIISGKGFGHNVGMSQYGAWIMAEHGYTYEEILQFYYTGITVG